MAKVGEGDPRWIVQGRADGTNVNNWHWSETDCLNWTKKTITTLLSNLTIFDDAATGVCKTGTVSSVTGECTANNRKGKTIFYYELEVKVPWEGKVNGDDTKIDGQFYLPYISEENDDDKMEVRVTCNKSGSPHDKFADIVRAKGIPAIQKQVAAFLASLKEEFTTKKPNPQSPPPAAETSVPTPTPSVSSSSPSPSSSSSTTKKESKAPSYSSDSFKTLNLKEEFTASPDSVYRMLTDPQMLNAITQGSASFEPKVGSSFSLFGGNVTGENVELVPNSKIVQKWRFKEWLEGHYSTVEMTITERKGKTILTLTQKGVPIDDATRTEDGWKRNVWGRGKMMFGFGAAPIF